jgi:hypothetical protein
LPKAALAGWRNETCSREDDRPVGVADPGVGRNGVATPMRQRKKSPVKKNIDYMEHNINPKINIP